MPLDAQVQAMIDMSPPMPALDTIPVDILRSAVREQSIAAPTLDVPLGEIYDRSIPGPGGELPVRVYRPQGAGSFPVLVYFHGGGFVTGDLDTHDSICRGLCYGASCVVMAVDYRLAPEHKFPAASDDAYAATLWAAKHAAELGGDPDRIAIGGDSAGALLSGSVTLRLRDRGGPALRGQLLFYGSMVYEIDAPTPSLEEFANGPWLRKDDIPYFWGQYLNNLAIDQKNPLACPIYASSHAHLPPAFVATAECDPTRDSAEHYAGKLRAAGVPVQQHRYAGMPHGFVSLVAILPTARKAVDDASVWLKKQFA